jgi:hypothetical protein
MQKTITIFVLCVLCVPCGAIYSQGVPEHLSWTTLYEFLGELASEQVISLNTTVKPYSRNLIL